MTYVLDAHVFVSASRLHYGFDFCLLTRFPFRR